MIHPVLPLYLVPVHFACFNGLLIEYQMWPFTTKGTLCRFVKSMRFIAISIRKLNKLSNDTKVIQIEALQLKIWQKDSVYFLLFPLFLTIYFAQYLKTSLADIKYILLWCVTNTLQWWLYVLSSQCWSFDTIRVLSSSTDRLAKKVPDVALLHSFPLNVSDLFEAMFPAFDLS